MILIILHLPRTALKLESMLSSKHYVEIPLIQLLSRNKSKPTETSETSSQFTWAQGVSQLLPTPEDSTKGKVPSNGRTLQDLTKFSVIPIELFAYLCTMSI